MDILRSIVVVAFILLLGACASPTKGMTPDQAAAYKVQAQYEREDRRAKRHDAIFAARDTCSAYGYVWWTSGFSSFETRRMKRDPNWLPKHAHVFDFACTTARDAQDIINRALGNDIWGRGGSRSRW